MITLSIDGAVSDVLHRAGFSRGDWRATGVDGSTVWTAAASGPLGQIRAKGSTRAEAWGRALKEAQRLGMFGQLGQ